MPRSGGGVYTLPAGSLVTDGVDDILATQHNTPLQDIATDMNTPRPIVAGGTGAATAADARTNLGATATGSSLFTAADAAAGRTALGAGRDWTEVAIIDTSSGTAFDVTSIPAGVAEIEIMFDFVSLSGTDAVIVQLGALGQPLLEITGYQSARGSFSGTTIPSPGVTMDDVNPGFILRLGAAGSTLVGGMRLVRGASQTLWHYTAITGMDGVTMQIGSGRKYMTGGRIDRFRITRSGSNTFDQGLINVRYR